MLSQAEALYIGYMVASLKADLRGSNNRLDQSYRQTVLRLWREREELLATIAALREELDEDAEGGHDGAD